MTSSPPPEPSPSQADGLRLALTTFTVLPLRAAPADRRTAGRAMLWAPVVGTAIGCALAVVCLLLQHAFPPGYGNLLAASITMALAALLTRGLHLDGLADTVDGLGSYGGRERSLAVMRAPDVGPFGVGAVVMVLLIDVAAVAVSMSADRTVVALLVAFTTGRLTVTWACTPRTPAARPDVLGALVAGTTSARNAALLTAGIAGLAGVLAAVTGDDVVPDASRAVAAVLVPLAVAHGLRAHAVRRFGGITGDVLGALVEVATMVALVIMAVGTT